MRHFMRKFSNRGRLVSSDTGGQPASTDLFRERSDPDLGLGALRRGHWPLGASL